MRRIGVSAGAAVMVCASAVGCWEPNPAFQSNVIRCDVTRKECRQEGVGSDGSVQCAAFTSAVQFSATACKDANDTRSNNTLCTQMFCAQPSGVAYGYPSGCAATGTDVTAQIPADGICRVSSSSDNARLALVSFTQRWRDCAPAAGGPYCGALNLNSAAQSGCYDLSVTRAVTQLLPPSDRRDRSVLISSATLSSPECPATGSFTTAYTMTPGVVASATAGGMTVAISAKSGLATVTQTCGDGSCTTTVNKLVVNLNDALVRGVPVTGLTVSTAGPIAVSGVADPDSGLISVPAGSVNLVATGMVNGARAAFVIQNKQPWRVGVTAAGLTIQGSETLTTSNASGRLMPVTLSVSATGKPASAQVQACAGASSRGRLFGFEDAGNWSSSTAMLSLITSPIKEGCGALAVTGHGYMTITSVNFSTAGLSPTPALSVDLFVPASQPNPYWIGATQMYLTCPSANVFNQYIGQVELTGKPEGRYSTLRFPLPAATLSTLRQSLNDCSFTLALNVNQTNASWIFDNLRFTP
jgi:hypothetical protein